MFGLPSGFGSPRPPHPLAPLRLGPPIPWITHQPMIFPSPPPIYAASAFPHIQTSNVGHSPNPATQMNTQPPPPSVPSTTVRPPSGDDKYYRCICGTHVHKGALAIAVIGSVSYVVSVITNIIVSESNAYLRLAVWPTLIGIFMYGFVVMGNRRKKPAFYYPYFIISIILMILVIFLSVLLIVIGIAVLSLDNTWNQYSADLPYVTEFERKMIGIGIIVYGAFLLLSNILNGYFFWVIYRDFKYIKNVLLNPMSNIPRI